MTDEMKRMQQEAEERVRQMHQRAQQYREPPPLTVHHEQPICEPQSSDKTASHDRLLALLLAVLLIKNNAKIELIIALLYLAL